MKLLSKPFLLAAGLLFTQLASAVAPDWQITDAYVQLSQKGGEAGPKQSFSTNSPISDPLVLKATDNLRILFSIKEGKEAKRAHQVFLYLQNPETGLESFFPFAVKENGKARLDLTLKDIPHPLLTADTLTATLAIASFGHSTPLQTKILTITPHLESAVRKSIPTAAPKYSSRPEIRHIHRSDPKQPPKIISIVFLLAVLATLPTLFGAWVVLGANVSHLPKALAGAPVSGPLFIGSLVALEVVFGAYYARINIFEALGAVLVIAPVTLVTGSRALREVRARRLAGER